jgi:hypothetical protein
VAEAVGSEDVGEIPAALDRAPPAVIGVSSR